MRLVLFGLLLAAVVFAALGWQLSLWLVALLALGGRVWSPRDRHTVVVGP